MQPKPKLARERAPTKSQASNGDTACRWIVDGAGFEQALAI